MKRSPLLQSWGRFPRVENQKVQTPYWASDIALHPAPVIARGQGRSYGDLCLNDGGLLIHTDHLNRVVSFDTERGLLTAEAGMTLDAVLKLIVPQGFFLPVTPGTKFVSLGGAIANDIHGKNHHGAGTFGRSVKRFSLLRSTGEVLECSPDENPDYFAATIAGLGLTGLILNATISLLPIQSAFIDQRVEKFDSLAEFFSLSKAETATYSVAWLDCLTEHDGIGRGHFITGEHSQTGSFAIHRDPVLACPLDAPGWVLRRTGIQIFNTLYFHRLRNKITRNRIHYDPFFYPLDGVKDWNRIYGKNGFLQFQCVLPPAAQEEGLQRILKEAKKRGSASFLAVLKEFGSLPSPGMLSFPRPGPTLALDFPYRGHKTVELFEILERITVDYGGALYPAKDALMSKESFHRMYPQLDRFMQYIDPAFSSSFSRRVL